MSKDPLGRGRPAAEDLRSRCVQLNRLGKRCGSPALEGSKVCKVHLGSVSEKKLATTSDRLIKLTALALDRLEEIIRTGAPEVAERACRTILDRTVPRPGAQHALVVNIGQNQPAVGVPGLGPAEMIRKRMLALVSNAAEADANPSPFQASDLGDGSHGEDDVIDAEIVPDPEPQRFRLVDDAP